MFLVAFHFRLPVSQSNVFCFFKRVENEHQKKPAVCETTKLLCFITNSCAATAAEGNIVIISRLARRFCLQFINMNRCR